MVLPVASLQFLMALSKSHIALICSGSGRKSEAEEEQEEQEQTMPNHILLPHLNQFLRDQQFTLHITANFNRPTTYEAGRDKIKTWASFVDRKLHGRLYYRKPIEQRLFFVAVPELGACSDNLHFHLLAKVPDESLICFRQVAEANWLSLVKYGSLHVQEIAGSEGDQLRVVSYDLKEVGRGDNYANWFFSTEFAPLISTNQ